MAKQNSYQTNASNDDIIALILDEDNLNFVKSVTQNDENWAEALSKYLYKASETLL